MEEIRIFNQVPNVSRSEKEKSYRQKGIVYWLTGLSGSGKSTIAGHFERKLHSIGVVTIAFDGDNIRSGLCKGLGFLPEGRKENLRRVAEVCKLNAENGLVVIASFISPFEEDREMVRNIIGEDYVEVFVSASLEICESRDVKGLYKKARLGEIPNFTGIGSPYENPLNADITLHTGTESVESCLNELIAHYSNVISESGVERRISMSDSWSLVNHGNNRMNLTERQHAVFIGRFQPLHDGHIKLFRQKLDQGVPLLVLVRDLVPDSNNPFTTEETMAMVCKVFKGEDVCVAKIPDIESVNWGRGVGYELNEFFPPETIGAISATQVRKSIENGNDEWKRFIDPIIHGDIMVALGKKK